MAVSASAKSRAAAISALIKRDSGYAVESSSQSRPTGIKVRAHGSGETSITIYDAYDGVNGQEQARKFVQQRRECIERDLARRGYRYYLTGSDNEDGTVRIQVRAEKDKPARKKAAPKTHVAKISFEIDPEAARQYLGTTFRGDDSRLAAAMADAISEMIEVSNAAALGAITIVKNEFVR